MFLKHILNYGLYTLCLGPGFSVSSINTETPFCKKEDMLLAVCVSKHMG